MSVPAAPPAQPQGYGKSLAAIMAGALATLVIGGTNAVLEHYGAADLSQTMVAAIQTLSTAGAVMFTPHSFGSSP